jgi:hypothetical protein
MSVEVGNPAPAVLRAAADTRLDQLVIGTRFRCAACGALLHANRPHCPPVHLQAHVWYVWTDTGVQAVRDLSPATRDHLARFWRPRPPWELVPDGIRR